MPSLRNTLIGLVAASLSTTAVAEHLRVVWSKGGFSSISGPSGGSVSSHFTGFAIINDNNEAIYTEASPADHSPCLSTGSGREFTVEGGCWNQARKFQCKSNLNGSPEGCEVKDKDGNGLGKGEGKTDTEFIGIAIAQDSSCVVEFNTEDGEDCPTENDLGVTSG
ncbi:hypothetical protein FZEAL_9491 [Fusarium zealandicum]|uniref:Uncharacterized protein n=1 Tax=Fusarium zealandicum TaxID=1053134 RepID=A0A8H4UAY1_9HYPO|nr:hypothetical protein FZEAL_9491 [Fusarium zealandicum]